jgi:hypothetical protein
MVKRTLIAVLLFTVVSGCSSRPESAGSHHPPVLDLVCPAEPPALTDEQVMATQNDPDAREALDRQFTIDALMSGRACRDALQRACEWHNVHGAKLDCSNPPFVRDAVQ